MAALNSQLASETLVDEATQRGSSDNISVKVVVLRPVALSDEIVGYFSARFRPRLALCCVQHSRQQ